jgi:hypothetical protein
VDVVDNVVCVEGKHEDKSEDGTKFTSRQFFRYRFEKSQLPPKTFRTNLYKFWANVNPKTTDVGSLSDYYGRFWILRYFKSIKRIKQIHKLDSRRYALPEGCAPEQVVSNLSADGVLLVTAPKLAIKDAEKPLPIQTEKK